MEIYTQKRPQIIRWIFAAILALCFAADLLSVLTGRAEFFDEAVFTAFHSFRDQFLTIIATGVTFCANTFTVLGLCVVLMILPTRTRFGIPLSLAAGLSAGCHHLLKEIIERARPDEAYHLVTASGFSFPSGHANTGIVFYLFLMILLRRYLILHDYKGIANAITLFFPLLTIAIGASRVYLGVHYPTDILGGWLLGSVLLIILVTLYDAFYPLKYRITYEQPAWDAMRKKKDWRRPANRNRDEQLIEFPKNRSPWKKGSASEKPRRGDEE